MWIASRTRSLDVTALADLDQLDGVAVGILCERDHRWRGVDSDGLTGLVSLGGQLLTERHDVRYEHHHAAEAVAYHEWLLATVAGDQDDARVGCNLAPAQDDLGHSWELVTLDLFHLQQSGVEVE